MVVLKQNQKKKWVVGLKMGPTNQTSKRG